MTVRPDYGLVLSASPKRGKSRATQAQALRGAFGDLELYLQEIVTDAKDGGDLARREALYQGRDMEGEKAKGRPMGGSAWKVDGLELIPRGAIDEKWEPLLRLVEGRTKAFVHATSARDVLLAIEVAQANGFLANTVMVVNGDAHKAANHIAEAGIPVIIAGDLTFTENDPVTGEEIETDVIAAFEAAGVTYALSSSDASTNSLWFRAERAIAQGTDPMKAFAAVMQTPADLLGVGDQVGSLEAGKLGNVVLLTGDPMDPSTWVDEVVIEGERVYRRSEDVRNKYVFEGEEPTGIDAMPRSGEQ
jgi:imidazolonepropionase-like amidohydrolase